MSVLTEAPTEVELEVLRGVVVRRPKAAAPTLTVDGTAGDAERGAILRTALQQRGVEVHRGLKAKLNACGGNGQCGTCWVNVLDGAENLSPRTAVEEKRGAKKPPSYRMACQAFVNGDVSVDMSE